MLPFVKNYRLLLILIVFVLLMFGFAFALVPIYNRLCQQLGINGKTNSTAVAYDADKATVDKNRTIVVEFLSTNNGSLPWIFYPKVKRITVHPGEIAKLAFYAENQTDYPMVVQAIPSVTPAIAAKYLKKTECFCFTQQKLSGHEGMDMPLLFHLDTELPSDISVITLSYTLFDVTDRQTNR